VHLLFLDESGKPSDKSFGLGGIAIRADQWRELRAGWQHACESCGWPADKEAKWHGIRSGEVPPELAGRLFEALSAAPITCFVVVLRPLAGRQVEGLERFFADDEATYATALTFIAERFQRFLGEQDSYGVIVLDSRQRDVDDRMRRFFDRLQEEGTPFTDLDRIVDSLLLGPSHFSLGLQAADLVVASTLAARSHLGDASRWHKQLLARFARHPATGEVSGVGLKEFPEKPHEEAPSGKLFEPRQQSAGS
jgi:Protein of unknown function (DUF3800)